MRLTMNQIKNNVYVYLYIKEITVLLGCRILDTLAITHCDCLLLIGFIEVMNSRRTDQRRQLMRKSFYLNAASLSDICLKKADYLAKAAIYSN